MKLTERLSSARTKYGSTSGFKHPEALRLYQITIQLREMPDGECQVVRLVGKEEYERCQGKWPYEHGALVIARGKNWKELGL